MKFSELVEIYNSTDMTLDILFKSIGKEIGMDISNNSIYWFSKDIINKAKVVKPITLTNKNNTFYFTNGENELFSINRRPYQQFNSNESLLRSSIFPVTDETGSTYDIHNNSYLLGSNGLYQFDDVLFNKYRYITFTGKHKLYYDALVDKTKGTIVKTYFDKDGDVTSKYYYDFNKKISGLGNNTDALNRIESVLDKEFPNLKGSLYKMTYSDLIDQYFYDINLAERLDNYKDLYITNGSKFNIRDDVKGRVQGLSIKVDTDRNKESYLAISNPIVNDLKLLCVTDLVNGAKLNKDLSKYITSELNYWFLNLDGNSLSDEKVLLSGLRDKLLEFNNHIYTEVNKYKKKNKHNNKKSDNDIIGSAMGISLITKNNTYLLNYGDTRIYSSLNDNLSRLTMDNTVVWDNYIKGNFNYEEASKYQRKSLLTNYVGNPDKYSELPDLFIIDNDKYDKLFVFSDGITDNLEESTMSNILLVNDGCEALRTIATQAYKHNRRKENVTGCCYIKK